MIVIAVFINIPKSTLLKFFSENCNQITHDELELLKNHIIKFCNETIMFWNSDLRKIVESIDSVRTPEELKSLNMKLVKRGLDAF
jgi:hypothetical protein